MQTTDKNIVQAMQLIGQYDSQLLTEMHRADWTVKTSPTNFDEAHFFDDAGPAPAGTAGPVKLTMIRLEIVAYESIKFGIPFLQYLAVVLSHEFAHLQGAMTELPAIKASWQFAKRLPNASFWREYLTGLSRQIRGDGQWQGERFTTAEKQAAVANFSKKQ